MGNNETQRSRTGIQGLDEILHGGLIAHRLYLIDGNPGAGKTTLALQYLMEGVRAGEKCLYVTLSESREELEAGARSHGWSLDGIEIVELIQDDQLDGQGQLTMFHPSEVELFETTRQVLEAVDRVNPTRMVLDSLSELRLLSQSSLRYRRQILALKQFFVGRTCTLLILDDRTAEGADIQPQSIAHGVIALETSAPPYGRARRELQVLKFRGSDFSSGLHDFVIRSGGLTVFPRLVAANHRIGFKRDFIESGVAALDTLLGGGMERGTSTLLMGPPGCGKSTIAMQYTVAAAQRGDHAAVFTFEESMSAMAARCSGIGLDIEGGVKAGRVLVRQIYPAEISPGEFASEVRRSVEEDHARVVVIDSLNGYLNAMPNDRFLAAQLHELLAYLSNQGVATFMVVAQSGIMGMMTSPVDASYLADTVVMLRFFEHQGTVKKAISVLKKRTGSHEESIREMWFDEAGIHLSEPLLNLRGVLTGVPVDVRENNGNGQPAKAGNGY